MNVLLITPLYHIEGRKELIHDTSAIHYLVRPWAREHNVVVVDIYLQSIKYVWRYLSSQARKYKDGYFYEVDGVKVGLIEVQKMPKQGPVVLKCQSKRIHEFIEDFLHRIDFEPDVVVAHVPICSAYVVSEIFMDKPKVAVFHSTDVIFWEKKKKCSDLVIGIYDKYFTRSRAIRDFFEHKGLNALSKDVIYSGVPSASNTNNNRIRNRIIYAGKFIRRKRVNDIIKALSIVQREGYSFTFDIYGDGICEDLLKRQAERQLDSACFRFCGKVSREELIKQLGNADFFIMVSERETLGLVYLEAMMQGCIPIGSEGEGIDGIIEDGINGYLVKPRNVDMLVEKVKICLDASESEKEQIRHNIHTCMETFSEYDKGMEYFNKICEPYNRDK
ncbi:glycosyltransferase family 4 protein [Butyrivibrio sp. AE3006]|uniref:glycosyltransferase family 4 protein n=1 Tax=Butyrivibrio sp. AE3006 TaxID=1280673 RepID=UPI00040F79F6|nr:glycosyltransferase family 4 protein [Butyrivibrio sp. AE3006]